MSETDVVIRLEGVNKSFGTKRAVCDLDLDVPRGSLCGFLGPNGAGKTTTIRMIMSIIYADSGSVRVLGGNALQAKDRIGYLPEERGLYRKMRVGEFIEYMARLKGVRDPKLQTKVKDWLERVDLPEVYAKRCQELSKGMQQKVQFLAAIIHEPELLILDEPFSGLDPVNTVLLNQLIRELHDNGTTVIFSTHILHQAELICDRIFLINHGVKLLDETLDEIRRRFDPRTIGATPVDTDVQLPPIDGVRDIHRQNGVLHLAMADDADPDQIMREVLDAAPMRSIELRQPTLEEVFVRLVMSESGEEAAAQARQELSHV